MCDFPSPVNIADFLLDDVVVTFDPSSMVGDRQNATITINDDIVLEGAHNFNVSIFSATPDPNVIVAHPLSAVVIISDNDGEWRAQRVCLSFVYICSVDRRPSSL